MPLKKNPIKYFQIYIYTFIFIAAILQADKCVADVKQNIKMCLDDYNIDPDIFLVNITHDRTKILGTRNIAQKFCQ